MGGIGVWVLGRGGGGHFKWATEWLLKVGVSPSRGGGSAAHPIHSLDSPPSQGPAMSVSVLGKRPLEEELGRSVRQFAVRGVADAHTCTHAQTSQGRSGRRDSSGGTGIFRGGSKSKHIFFTFSAFFSILAKYYFFLHGGFSTSAGKHLLINNISAFWT